jgi:hypothetical protein
MSEPIRAALYARVSTSGYGQDVGLQLDELRQVAAQRSWAATAASSRCHRLGAPLTHHVRETSTSIETRAGLSHIIYDTAVDTSPPRARRIQQLHQTRSI